MSRKKGPLRHLDVTQNQRQAVTAAARLFAVQPSATSRDALVAAVDAIRDAKERDGRPLRDAPSEIAKSKIEREKREATQGRASIQAAQESEAAAQAEREAGEAAEAQRIAEGGAATKPATGD